MLVVIMGLPGSGKTFFAKKLSAILGATCIGSDDVRTGMGYRSRYQAHDKYEVYMKMLGMTEREICRGNDVIVDATFYRSIFRTSFHAMARRLQIPVAYILIEAREPVIRARLSRPRQRSEADYMVYQQVRQEFQPVMEPHLVLVSEDNNISQMIDQAVVYLQGFMNVRT